jgi:hypothetical protein
MKTLEIKRATGELCDYARQVRKEPLIVTDNGKPLLALMPIENADLETVSLSTDPRFIALIEHSRAVYKPGTGIPLEEIRNKYGLPAKRRPKRARKAAGKARSPARP